MQPLKKRVSYVVLDENHHYKVEIDTLDDEHDNNSYTVTNVKTPSAAPTKIKVENLDMEKNTLIHADITINGKKMHKICQFVGASREIDYNFYYKEQDRKLTIYSEVEYQLLKHMPIPKIIDSSKIIVS